MKSISHGLFWGLLGVFSFSLTFPATKFALESFSPGFIAIGRVGIAGFFASIFLIFLKEKLPAKKDLFSFFLVAAGIVVGFPVFTILALQTASSAHSAVVIGLLPLGTLLITVLRTKERPSFLFWAATLIGSLTISIYILGFPPKLQISLSLEKMNWTAADTLVVEDSIHGVKAGKAAGMRVCGFLGGSHILKGHKQTIQKSGADFMIADLRELIT